MRKSAIAFAALLVACAATTPEPAVAPQGEPYGWLRDPFPLPPAAAPPEPAPAPAQPPAEEAPKPAPAPAPPKPKSRTNWCGVVCGECSRASEACDKEIRSTNSRGEKCKKQEVACGALVQLKRATSCKCPDEEDDE